MNVVYSCCYDHDYADFRPDAHECGDTMRLLYSKISNIILSNPRSFQFRSDL